ncbi:unknown [Firmicutes bacterium CAG:534]|nr:unknown [Firmicutes bacterium CAG:534]
MKKKAFKRKRNILNVLAALVMLMAMLLTACSSGKTDAALAHDIKYYYE